MPRALSVYLDLVRFTAALLVFATHANYPRFTSGWLSPLAQFGHEAVIVFFVLSGYVIAYVSDQRESTAGEYFIARFARLWSVVLPALVLTVVLDCIGTRINPSAYTSWWAMPDEPWWRVVSSLFFVNELWFCSIRPFSNGPFWSIGYEFWYYVLFAALYFTPQRWKAWAFGAACLVAGPRILLLFPVWLTGSVAYRISRRPSLPAALAWLCLLGPVLAYSWLRAEDSFGWLNKQMSQLDTLNLLWSREFTTDWFLGILIAGHFVGFAALAERFDGVAAKIEVGVRFFAGYTLSIYLYHFPLLVFLGVWLQGADKTWISQSAVVVGALFAAIMLGNITEKKKQSYRFALAAIWRRCAQPNR